METVSPVSQAAYIHTHYFKYTRTGTFTHERERDVMCVLGKLSKQAVFFDMKGLVLSNMMDTRQSAVCSS